MAPALHVANPLHGTSMLVPQRPPHIPHTFPSRLDGDFLTDVATARRGDSSHPQHVLLPTVQVSDAVEELVWAGLVLTGGLQGGKQEKAWLC